MKQRAARLRATAAAALNAELTARIGGKSDVLIEAPGRGRADCYAAVRFESEFDAASVQRMRFVAVQGDTLLGVPLV